MQTVPAVEQGGRGGAEAPALVEAVERDHADPPHWPGLRAVRAQDRGPWIRASRRAAEPPDGGCGLGLLVHDQIAVVHGLHAQEIEVQVSRRIEFGLGQGLSRSKSQPDLDCRRSSLRRRAEDCDGTPAAMEPGDLSCSTPVPDDVPAQHFLIDVGAAGYARRSGRNPHPSCISALGIQDDGHLSSCFHGSFPQRWSGAAQRSISSLRR